MLTSFCYSQNNLLNAEYAMQGTIIILHLPRTEDDMEKTRKHLHISKFCLNKTLSHAKEKKVRQQQQTAQKHFYIFCLDEPCVHQTRAGTAVSCGISCYLSGQKFTQKASRVRWV